MQQRMLSVRRIVRPNRPDTQPGDASLLELVRQWRQETPGPSRGPKAATTTLAFEAWLPEISGKEIVSGGGM
jgi:hypothetical protein